MDEKWLLEVEHEPMTYRALINLLYFTVDYQADVKTIYHELQENSTNLYSK